MALNKLLIVDDEESVAITMQAILQLDGHNVEMCTRGDVALRRIGETTFDLVLTDLRLDDLDGLQIVAETHRRSPETIVIVLTGYASLESAVKDLARETARLNTLSSTRVPALNKALDVAGVPWTVGRPVK